MCIAVIQRKEGRKNLRSETVTHRRRRESKNKESLTADWQFQNGVNSLKLNKRENLKGIIEKNLLNKVREIKGNVAEVGKVTGEGGEEERCHCIQKRGHNKHRQREGR